MLLSNKAFYRQTKLLFFPTDTDPKQPRTRKIEELIHTPMISDPGQFSPSQKSKTESHLHISLEILLESASSGLHGMQHHKLDQTLLIDIRLFSEIHVRTSIRVTSPFMCIVACNSRRILFALLVQVVPHLKTANGKVHFSLFAIIANHISRISVLRHTSNVVP